MHGLFRRGEDVEAHALYLEVAQLFRSHELATDEDRHAYIEQLVAGYADAFSLPENGDQQQIILALIERLFDFEGWFLLPEIDWNEQRSISQYWEIREELAFQKQLLVDFGRTDELICEALFHLLWPIYGENPSLQETVTDTDAISIPTTLLYTVPDLGEAVEQMLATAADTECEWNWLFPRLYRNLDRNLIRASGGNPDDPNFNRAPKLPSQADSRDPLGLVTTYLGGTPLEDIFAQPIQFTIPTKSRFEHHHIVAGTGHGKTQTLQYLIAQDLEAVAEGERTVIVIDSQGDLIRQISNLAVFAPDGPLHDQLTIIDPADVEWPVSLNMFDVGVERLNHYPALERERLTNSILELYDFVLGSLLDAGMTQKQNVIFRYVTRLMLHIPDATIHTLRELMEPGAEKEYAEAIAKLTGSARRFFDTEFAGREFVQTKQQVLRRLWGILENQTFERMFSHPRSKLDLYTEMNAGRVILINTAKDLLKEQGTEIFGRFFIALITQAAQERATLPEANRLPTMVYIDEAADYFDRNIGIILAQARKYNVGMVLAHQFLGQLDPKLQEAFAANTSIKFAGGVSAKDARSFASMLYCDASLIESQPKGSFAAHIRGVTKAGLPLQFPFGHMEQLPQMSEGERQALRDNMRERYAVHFSKIGNQSDDSPAEDDPQETDQPEPMPKKKPPKSGSGQIDTNPGGQW